MRSKWIIAAVAIVFTLVFTTCEDLGYTTPPALEAAAVDAQAPNITTQPQGGVYTIGGAALQLTVTAESADEGALSYQWYTATDAQYAANGGDQISGAGQSAYAVNLAEGAWQVYVKITNTNDSVGGNKTASVNSNLIRVNVNDPNNAEYPHITSEPASTSYEWAAGLTPDALSVTASVSAGALSYQWHSSAAYSNEGGTAIPGATSASYQPAVSGAGISYYYVVVTNTNNSASGRKTSITNSSPAVIRAVTTNAAVTVDTAVKYQYVRGFGGMAPFWGNSPQDSVRDYQTMYSPAGLGYNMLRIMIPVDSTDIRATMRKALNNELSGSRDRRHYYEIVKLVNGYGGYVLASPWSPPPEWKSNNDIRGGGAGAEAKLLKKYWMDYADYLHDYCRIMYDNGAPIYAVSIQNEPNFQASYDGCEWTGVEMRDFFKQVGFFTEGVKGWGGGVEIPRVLAMNGESANSPTDSSIALNDALAKQYIDLYARHNYGSQQVDVTTAVHAAGKEIWMTEHNLNGGNDESYPNDSTYDYLWKFLNSLDVTIRLNKENAFIWWYGKRFYSMIGEGDYTTVNGAILPRGWAMSHFAKYATGNNQVAVTVTGTSATGGALTTGSNVNNTSYNVDSTAARVTAYESKDGNSISLVLFTPTNTSGAGGTDMGSVKIAFPAGFAATKVTAMRTKKDAMGKEDADTILLKGGTAAVVNLPAGQILSVKFTK